MIVGHLQTQYYSFLALVMYDSNFCYVPMVAYTNGYCIYQLATLMISHCYETNAEIFLKSGTAPSVRDSGFEPK
jgi:hypothetical protein